MSWYCIRTQPKREQVAAGHIAARGLAEVYAPELLIERKTRTGKKRFRESLFPSYIFVETENYENVDTLGLVPGVSRLVRRGVDPVVVSSALIEELRTEYPGEQLTIAVPDELLPDTPVDIVEGCFQGESARVIGTLPSGDRIRILLEFLGRDIAIDIPAEAALAKPH
ncbi:MAG: transcription termination/antitermination protein NusG [Opitutales bacterium]